MLGVILMIESPRDYILQEDLENIANSDIPLEKLGNSTILITGATGLVGSQVIKALLCCNRIKNSNFKVLAVVRNLETAKEKFGELANNENLKFVVNDVTNPFDLEDDIDYIIHGASVTNSKQMVTYPVETINTTILGTTNILELAKQKNVKNAIYLSSMEMYGAPNPDLEIVNEKDLGYIDCLNVRSCYSEGKRMAENLCVAYSHEYGVNVCIARLAQTFGAGVGYGESRVFAQFAKSLIEEKDIVLHTTGESYGNYCYTADCVRGLLFLLAYGKSGDAYNIANPNTSIQIKDMAQMIADKSNGKIKVVFDIPEDALKYGYAPPVKMKLGSAKLQGLGWKPQYNLPEMYDRLIESMVLSK